MYKITSVMGTFSSSNPFPKTYPLCTSLPFACRTCYRGHRETAPTIGLTPQKDI